MTFLHFAYAYSATLAAFLALDAMWLGMMSQRLYRSAIGHLMREGFAWEAAAAFYVLYVLGLVVFAVASGLAKERAAVAAARGALFGLIAYGTYDLTNQATLRGWPWTVTIADLTWGAVASAIAAAVATRVTLAAGGRRP